MPDVILTPSGRLVLVEGDAGAAAPLPDAFHASLARAFSVPSRGTGRIGIIGSNAEAAVQSCGAWAFA